MIKATTFKDFETYNRTYDEYNTVTAAQQLENFIENKSIREKDIVNVSYSVTHEGYDSAGNSKYKNHILLVYKEAAAC